jgi:hypothetical protein
MRVNIHDSTITKKHKSYGHEYVFKKHIKIVSILDEKKGI